jgi:hypothetical protein
MMGANTAPDPEPDLSSAKVFPICYPNPMKFTELLSKLLVSQIPNGSYRIHFRGGIRSTSFSS